jgi:hypothetical protein
MPGTRGPSVGRWGHGRSGDRDSQRWLAAPISREARLIPEGIGVTREGWLASGWCGPIPEADSRPLGPCAPECSRAAQWATAPPLPLLEEGVGARPGGRRSRPIRGLRQHRRSGGAGGSRPAPSGTNSGGNGCGFGQPAALPFEARPARRRPGSTPVATRRHDDQVCVFDAPGGAPHRIAPTAIA